MEKAVDSIAELQRHLCCTMSKMADALTYSHHMFGTIMNPHLKPILSHYFLVIRVDFALLYMPHMFSSLPQNMIISMLHCNTYRTC